MNALPQTTKRRLKKIPQVPSVWEGDRRSVSGIGSNLEPAPEGKGECIIWVDGSEGLVRAMDVVSPEMGPEAMVRTLLRAIETPHGPAKPARPQKIVVRDREIQFFLRGALQNLEIAIEYVPELPLIDELFRGFEEIGIARKSRISPQYEQLLRETAYQVWKEEPWNLIADHNIIAIELNRWDVETVYACVMGMLGREYGVILYRSLNTMKQFRSAALGDESFEQLEKAFLSQDCWFLNFEAKGEDLDLEDEEETDLAELSPDEIRPMFGSVHPYEGMRPFLDEEEAIAVYVALKSLLQFFGEGKSKLTPEKIPALSKSYSLELPPEFSREETVVVKVSTMPELAQELLEMLEEAELEEEREEHELNVPIQEDLVPEDAYISLELVPWELLSVVRDRAKTYYQSQGAIETKEGLPVILIQTTRPKAKILIETLQAAGGLKGICFNPGEDPFTGIDYELGILQTGNGNLYLFGEFSREDLEITEAMRKWNKRCQKTSDYCGLIVAMGVTGASRGHPQPRDMMALFEAKMLSTKQLGMGVLQLMPEF
ncbi:MAG: hypothetical protein AB4038_00320 [Prochloraceae cyanobacterium]